MSRIALSRTQSVLGRRVVLAIVAAVAVVAAAATFSRWWPVVQGWIAAATKSSQQTDEHAEGEKDADGHAAHGATESLELSAQARKNIGLEVGKVVLGPYERTVSIPGIVVERSGHTISHVTAPLAGVVTQVYASRGEAVSPDQRLFELRLIDEDVVSAQASLLRTVEELDVIGREIARLEEVTRQGSVPRKEMLERQYEKQKQEAMLRAQKQALLLHGLSQQQVDEIVSSHTLLRTFTILAPPAARESNKGELVLQLQQLNVATGQSVAVGETLAVLADPSQLLIEGDAFEKDARQISRAAEQGWKVSAVLQDGSGKPEILRDLPILFVDGKVDPASRTFRFFVNLPNLVVRDVRQPEGPRYVDWRFKLGQRMQILVPVEVWKDRIVLPVDAVAQDGIENFVFQENGKKFDRRPVHVEHRDESQVVVAYDGAVFPGDTLALTSAQQLLIAIKNKAGGAPDPHAGHNH
jgi:cobalt-zinc-cadmium efflux system membrane fusion protein